MDTGPVCRLTIDSMGTEVLALLSHLATGAVGGAYRAR